MNGISSHDSAHVRLFWPGTTWANEPNFVMNHALGAGLIARPVDQQSIALPLYHGCPHTIISRIAYITAVWFAYPWSYPHLHPPHHQTCSCLSPHQCFPDITPVDNWFCRSQTAQKPTKGGKNRQKQIRTTTYKHAIANTANKTTFMHVK